MFIKQVAQRVFVYNDNMEMVGEFDNAKFRISDSRIKIISGDEETRVFCDMPAENTSILYK